MLDKRDGYYPKWFNHVMVGKDQAFPLPTGNNAIKQEIRAVMNRLDKLNNLDTRSILDRYLAMIENGKQIEKEFYYNETKMKDNETEFWELLHNTHFDALEGYIALSTIITVVVGIQMGKDIPGLTSTHNLISCFENMINYLDHSHIKSVDKIQDCISEQENASLLKNSKYILRIALTLNKTDLVEEHLSPEEMSVITDIVKQRGTPTSELFNSELFGRYKLLVTEVMSKFDLIRRDMLEKLEGNNTPIALEEGGAKRKNYHSRRNKINPIKQKTRKRNRKHKKRNT